MAQGMFVELDPDRYGEVVEILADGFRDDPLVGWTVGGDPSRREARARRMFTLLAGNDFRKGHRFFVSSDGAAASVWARPDHWRTSGGDQLRSLPGVLRLLGFHAFGVMRAYARIEADHPKPPHWYVLGLAVRRARQGQGLGSACLADGLARMPDAEHMPAYLESSNARNIPLYERAGFRASEPIQVGGSGGPIVTPMWRDAR